MNRELELKLVAKYPELFKDYGGDPVRTAMAWGMDCDSGWYDIIEEFCATVSKLENPPYFQQIKEKFGSLRLYMSHYDEEVNKAERIAEEKSARTCEVCGKPGKITGEFWLKATCKEHRDS